MATACVTAIVVAAAAEGATTLVGRSVVTQGSTVMDGGACGADAVTSVDAMA